MDQRLNLLGDTCDTVKVVDICSSRSNRSFLASFSSQAALYDTMKRLHLLNYFGIQFYFSPLSNLLSNEDSVISPEEEVEIISENVQTSNCLKGDKTNTNNNKILQELKKEAEDKLKQSHEVELKNLRSEIKILKAELEINEILVKKMNKKIEKLKDKVPDKEVGKQQEDNLTDTSEVKLKRLSTDGDVITVVEDNNILDHLNTDMGNLLQIQTELALKVSELDKIKEENRNLKYQHKSEIDALRNEKNVQMEQLIEKNKSKSKEIADLQSAYQHLERDSQMTEKNLEEDLRDYKERYEYMKEKLGNSAQNSSNGNNERQLNSPPSIVFSQMQERLKCLEKENFDLSDKIRNYEQETVQEKVGDRKIHHSNDDTNTDLQKRLTCLQKENFDYNDRIKEFEATMLEQIEKIKDYEATMLEQVMNIDQLQIKNQKYKTEIERLMREKEDSESHEKFFSERYEVVMTELNATKSKLTVSNEKLKASENMKATLMSQLESKKQNKIPIKLKIGSGLKVKSLASLNSADNIVEEDSVVRSKELEAELQMIKEDKNRQEMEFASEIGMIREEKRKAEAENMKLKLAMKEKDCEIEDIIQENVRNVQELQSLKDKQSKLSGKLPEVIDLDAPPQIKTEDAVNLKELKRDNEKLLKKIDFIEEHNKKQIEDLTERFNFVSALKDTNKRENDELRRQIQILKEKGVSPLKFVEISGKNDNKEIAELQSTIRRLKVQLEERDMEVDEINEKHCNEIISLQDDIRQKTEEIANIVESVKPFDQSSTESCKEMFLLKEEYRKTHQNLGECLLDKMKLEQKLRSKEREYKELDANFKFIRDNCDKLAEEKEKLLKVEDLENQLKELCKKHINEKARLQSELDDLEDNLKEAEKESVKYKNLLEKTEKIVRSVSDEVIPMQKEIKDKDKELKILENENTDLKFENLEVKKQIKKLNSIDNDAEKLRSENQKLVKSCNLIQFQLNQEVKKSKSQTKALQEEVLALKMEIDQVNEQKNQISSQLEDVMIESSSNSKTITDYVEEVKNLNEKVEKLQDIIQSSSFESGVEENLEKELTNLKLDNEKMKELLQNKARDHSKKLTQLTNEMNYFKSKYTNVSNNIEKLKGERDELKKKCTGLQDVISKHTCPDSKKVKEKTNVKRKKNIDTVLDQPLPSEPKIGKSKPFERNSQESMPVIVNSSSVNSDLFALMQTVDSISQPGSSNTTLVNYNDNQEAITLHPVNSNDNISSEISQNDPNPSNDEVNNEVEEMTLKIDPDDIVSVEVEQSPPPDKGKPAVDRKVFTGLINIFKEMKQKKPEEKIFKKRMSLIKRLMTDRPESHYNTIVNTVDTAYAQEFSNFKREENSIVAPTSEVVEEIITPGAAKLQQAAQNHEAEIFVQTQQIQEPRPTLTKKLPPLRQMPTLQRAPMSKPSSTPPLISPGQSPLQRRPSPSSSSSLSSPPFQTSPNALPRMSPNQLQSGLQQSQGRMSSLQFQGSASGPTGISSNMQNFYQQVPMRGMGNPPNPPPYHMSVQFPPGHAPLSGQYIGGGPVAQQTYGIRGPYPAAKPPSRPTNMNPSHYPNQQQYQHYPQGARNMPTDNVMRNPNMNQSNSMQMMPQQMYPMQMQNRQTTLSSSTFIPQQGASQQQNVMMQQQVTIN